MSTLIGDEPNNLARDKTMKDKTEQIRKLADIKSQETVDKALKAIDELVKSGRNVTFYNVYTSAGISKSFVYNNEKIRSLIESYRNKPIQNSRNTDPKDSIIQMQKQRIKELERILENHDNVMGKLEKIQSENETLKKQLRKAYEY